MAKSKKTAKKKQPKAPIQSYVPTLGDKHSVDDVYCVIKIVNAGMGWLFPIIDDPDDGLVARHIAYGKIDETGKVVRV